MKTSKEYPATHSMSTSWFAIDEDGNVAIVNFEENGPVASPADHDEHCTASLVENGLDSTGNGGLIYKNYTDEQIAPMFQEVPDGLNEFNTFEDYFFDILQIDVSRTQEFLEIIHPIIESGEHEIICFSRTLGIYSSGGIDDFKEVYTRLRESGIVKRVLRTDPMYDVDDIEEFSQRYPIPFYVYNQEYGACDTADLNKVYTPKVPCVNEKQLSDKERVLAFRVKGNFAKIDHIQPSADYPFTTHDYMDSVDIEGQPYYRMRLTGNTDDTAYVYDNLFSGLQIDESVCIKCPIFQSLKNDSWSRPRYYSGQEMTSHPTVAIINDCDTSMPYEILHRYPEIAMRSFHAYSVVCQSEYFGYQSPYEEQVKTIKKQVEERIFEKYCHGYFEHILEIFKPYVLILNKHAFKTITTLYEHDDACIQINGVNYAYFLTKDIEKHYDEIIDLARKPYRGKIIPKVIPVEEAERIGVKQKK